MFCGTGAEIVSGLGDPLESRGKQAPDGSHASPNRLTWNSVRGNGARHQIIVLCFETEYTRSGPLIFLYPYAYPTIERFQDIAKLPQRGKERLMARKRVLAVGLGTMGMSHALAYSRIEGFEVVGVCERRIAERELPEALRRRGEVSRVPGGDRPAFGPMSCR